MKINKLSLPYPLLTNINDDIRGSYTANLSYELTDGITTLYIEHIVENETINTLIEEGSAEFCIEVHCPQTLYRKTFNSIQKDQTVSIHSLNLRNKTVVSFYIIATTNIPDYSPKEMNEEYDNNIFSLEAGDVLGYGGESNIFIAKNWRELMAVTSFMEVEANKELDSGPILIELSQDKIIVKMPKIDYPKYTLFNTSKAYYPLFHASLVFPVLMVALSYISSSDTQYESSAWFQNLQFKIEQSPELNTLSLDSPENLAQIAQIILKLPISRSLEGIDNLWKEESNHDE